jgi:hypothetical protein
MFATALTPISAAANVVGRVRKRRNAPEGDISISRFIDETARQRARELVNTPEFAKAQRESKKVEALFAELKNQIGLRRLRLRRLKFVREQFFLAAVAQNIKRLVRFLSQPTTPTMEAAT